MRRGFPGVPVTDGEISSRSSGWIGAGSGGGACLGGGIAGGGLHASFLVLVLLLLVPLELDLGKRP